MSTKIVTTFDPEGHRAWTLAKYRLWDGLNGPLAPAAVEVPAHWELADFAKLQEVALDTLVRYALGELLMTRQWAPGCNCSAKALAAAAAQLASRRPTPGDLRRITSALMEEPAAGEAPTSWQRITVALPPRWPAMLSRLIDGCGERTPRDAERVALALSLATLSRPPRIDSFERLDQRLADEAAHFTTEPRLSDSRVWVLLEPMPTGSDPLPRTEIIACNPAEGFPFAPSLRQLASRLADRYYRRGSTDGRGMLVTALQAGADDVIESVLAVDESVDHAMEAFRSYAAACWQERAAPAAATQVDAWTRDPIVYAEDLPPTNQDDESEDDE